MIHLGLRLAGDLERDGLAASGVGIDPDALRSIFEPFVRANGTHERSEGGLGLGLTLVKRLVELHDGTVSASSAGPNRGSEIVVRLPRASHPSAASGPAEPRSGGGRARHVLIVDDNPDVREALRLLLEAWGHRVEEAENGKRGLEIIQRSRPDVVLVDIGLPDLDGCSVARAVRSARGAKAPLLVAVTGYGGAAERRRTSEAGFDAHLTKPFDTDELARILVSEERRLLPAS